MTAMPLANAHGTITERCCEGRSMRCPPCHRDYPFSFLTHGFRTRPQHHHTARGPEKVVMFSTVGKPYLFCFLTHPGPVHAAANIHVQSTNQYMP